jgi:hypothetical protein
VTRTPRVGSTPDLAYVVDRGARATARHELGPVDDAALVAARHADRLVAAAREAELTRWLAFMEPIPDHLRDDGLAGLRSTALRARAAYGPKDSIRDALPDELTVPFLESIDRLLRLIARRQHDGG